MERGSHARDVYSAQDTSRKGTARVEQEEDVNREVIAKEWYEIWKKGTRARRGKVPNKA